MPDFKIFLDSWLKSNDVSSFEYISPEFTESVTQPLEELTKAHYVARATPDWITLRSPQELLLGQLAFYVPPAWQFNLPNSIDGTGGLIVEGDIPRQSILWMNRNSTRQFLTKLLSETKVVALYTYVEEHEEQGRLTSVVMVTKENQMQPYWSYGFYTAGEENVLRISADADSTDLLHTQLTSLLKSSPWAMWGWRALSE